MGVIADKYREALADQIDDDLTWCFYYDIGSQTKNFTHDVHIFRVRLGAPDPEPTGVAVPAHLGEDVAREIVRDLNEKRGIDFAAERAIVASSMFWTPEAKRNAEAHVKRIREARG